MLEEAETEERKAPDENSMVKAEVTLDGEPEVSTPVAVDYKTETAGIDDSEVPVVRSALDETLTPIVVETLVSLPFADELVDPVVSVG